MTSTLDLIKIITDSGCTLMLPPLERRESRSRYTYPLEVQNLVTSRLGDYNKLFYERFDRTGIPSLLEGITGMPFRPFDVKEDLEEKKAKIVYKECALWEEVFKQNMAEGRWMAVNRVPAGLAAVRWEPKIVIDLLRGVQCPWRYGRVRAGQLTFKINGDIKLAVGQREITGVLGKRSRDNQTIRKDIAKLLGEIDVINKGRGNLAMAV